MISPRQTPFPDLIRRPDSILATTEEGIHPASLSNITGNPSRWEREEVLVTIKTESPESFSIHVEAPTTSLRQLSLRWNIPFAPGTLLLGDAWERSYGDLEWRGYTMPRMLPWYFLATDGTRTMGCGVSTGGASLACWQTDANGITLHLDLRSGGTGVRLGTRLLNAATVIQRRPVDGESPFRAAGALCRSLCSKPLFPKDPIIGHNDWYWLYGKNSESLILDATRRFLDLFPAGNPIRPWSVIDDGWQATEVGWEGFNGGPWSTSNSHFPDMAALASKIKALGARPGIWMRPLLTRSTVPDNWKLNQPFASGRKALALDPSVPEVLDLVRTDITRLCDWGYELIKHDFSTFDITGRWGFEASPTASSFVPDGWRFADITRTTAEIIVDFYRAIREAAGNETFILGCNTIGHLGAGLIDIQRTGDDTSASDWDRTRRMGVNTLAFRLPHHGAFYAIDADCVPVSPLIPWHNTEEWMTLVARSGTPLFLSLDPTALGPEQNAALRTALVNSLRSGVLAEPLDWIDSHIPSRWSILSGSEKEIISLSFRHAVSEEYEVHVHDAPASMSEGVFERQPTERDLAIEALPTSGNH